MIKLSFGPEGLLQLLTYEGRAIPAQPLQRKIQAQDMGDKRQGHLTIDKGPETGTGGLWLCQQGLSRRELIRICLARRLALMKKPVLNSRSGM